MKLRLSVNFSEHTGKYVYCSSHDIDGDIDTDDKTVTFTHNIFPDMIEQDLTAADVVESLDDNIKMLKLFQDFVNQMFKEDHQEEHTSYEYDPYPKEQDLNVRVIAGFDHPAFAKIKNQLYDME